MHTHTFSCYCLPPASPPTFDSTALRLVWFLGNTHFFCAAFLKSQKHEQCQRPTNTKHNGRSAVTTSGSDCRCGEINESKSRNRRKRNDGESFECCVPERLCLFLMIKYFFKC